MTNTTTEQDKKQWLLSAESILDQKRIRRTSMRIKILSYMLSVSRAVTKKEIEDHFHHFNRITLYLTLKYLLECRVIHGVFGFEVDPKFALKTHIKRPIKMVEKHF